MMLEMCMQHFSAAVWNSTPGRVTLGSCLMGRRHVVAMKYCHSPNAQLALPMTSPLHRRCTFTKRPCLEKGAHVNRCI